MSLLFSWAHVPEAEKPSLDQIPHKIPSVALMYLKTYLYGKKINHVSPTAYVAPGSGATV